MRRNNSGITLMALILTIIVLLIIVSISVYEGKQLISKSKTETLKTFMLTIKAKSKSYAEEIDAKIWTETEANKETSRNTEFGKKGFSIYPNNLSGEVYSSQINSEIDKENCICYTISANGLIDMGLEDAQNETFIVIYDKDDFKKIDIVYPKGEKYNNKTIYTLSVMEQELSN